MSYLISYKKINEKLIIFEGKIAFHSIYLNINL